MAITRDDLIDRVTDIIGRHTLVEYGIACTACHNKKLYAEGGGMSQSRHRAEKIVEMLINDGHVELESE